MDTVLRVFLVVAKRAAGIALSGCPAFRDTGGSRVLVFNPSVRKNDVQPVIGGTLFGRSTISPGLMLTRWQYTTTTPPPSTTHSLFSFPALVDMTSRHYSLPGTSIKTSFRLWPSSEKRHTGLESDSERERERERDKERRHHRASLQHNSSSSATAPPLRDTRHSLSSSSRPGCRASGWVSGRGFFCRILYRAREGAARHGVVGR